MAPDLAAAIKRCKLSPEAGAAELRKALEETDELASAADAACVDNDAQSFWWSKGGTLRGGSPPRIRWYRGLAEWLFDAVTCTCSAWVTGACVACGASPARPSDSDRAARGAAGHIAEALPADRLDALLALVEDAVARRVEAVARLAELRPVVVARRVRVESYDDVEVQKDGAGCE